MSVALIVVIVAILIASVVVVVQNIILSLELRDLKTRAKKVELVCSAHGESIINTLLELSKIIDALSNAVANSHRLKD